LKKEIDVIVTLSIWLAKVDERNVINGDILFPIIIGSSHPFPPSLLLKCLMKLLIGSFDAVWL